MSEEVAWPPTSPKAALLSSPSGRKRYAEEMHRSPVKRTRTTPGLLDRLRAARTDNDQFEGSDDENGAGEEDEETLKLQLAAIEAKLKLKRLQQSKAKEGGPSRPASATDAQPSETVQVGLSPTRKAVKPTEPRSPGRVLLGIDKGKTGADVSLKRSKSVSERALKGTALFSGETRIERSSSRISQLSSRHTTTSSTSSSFSERMAAVRDRDRARDQRRNATNSVRTSSFKIDKAEMDGYRALAEEDRKRAPSTVQRAPTAQSYSRDEILRAKETADSGLSLRKSQASRDPATSRPSSRGPSRAETPSQPASLLWEEFSGISLASRILPHSFLKRTLPEEQFKTYTLPDLLADVKSPEYEVPDGVGDYVVFAIIASKSGALDHKKKVEEQSVGSNDWEGKWDDGSQNQKRFIAMTLTDLEWTVDMYLFGTAVPRYHRLSPGTVVAILNPGIMPPKKGKEDTGAFSLTLHDGDDTILEIGTASELGFCNAVRKDGKECGQWVHVTKSEICEFHLNLQLYKTEQGRMGLNSGSNGFGGGGGGRPGTQQHPRRNIFDNRAKGSRAGEGSRQGLLPRKDGPRYDHSTESSYYVAPSSRPAPAAQKTHAHPFGVSASRALDHDDPFISDGQLLRDKKAQLQKRKERLAQESDIAAKLGAMSSSRAGAGAEYMRHRTGTATKADMGSQSSSRVSAQTIRSTIMRSKSDAGGGGGATKRGGDSVRLSPVKKTRFVTEKGIRVAGRESLGVVTTNDDNDDDEDDDLDIV